MRSSRSKPTSCKQTPATCVPHGSLLAIEQLSADEISSLLKQAAEMQSRLKKSPSSRQQLTKKLSGRRVALLFYEASTRTRVSFEFAAKNLGAVTTVVTAAASSIEKGESLADTGYTIQATGAEVVVMRHP